MKKKTISVKLTKERKRWSLTIEGTDVLWLDGLQAYIQRNAGAFTIVNLASPWSEIKPKKAKSKVAISADLTQAEVSNV